MAATITMRRMTINAVVFMESSFHHASVRARPVPAARPAIQYVNIVAKHVPYPFATHPCLPAPGYGIFFEHNTCEERNKMPDKKAKRYRGPSRPVDPRYAPGPAVRRGPDTFGMTLIGV